MRHIGILPGHGVRLHLVSLVVLVPAAAYPYLLAGSVLVGKALQLHEHAVFIGRDVVAFLVHEVQHHAALAVKGVEVVPVADDHLVFPAHVFLSLQ